MTRGFSLIETILYIALFGTFMSGAVATAYTLLSGVGNVNTNTVVQEEGNFVLGKLRFALGSASGISVPSSHELVVSRYGGTTADISFVGGSLTMSENGGTAYPLTTGNVTVSNFVVEKIPAAGGSPAGVIATTTVNGTDFVIRQYLHN